MCYYQKFGFQPIHNEYRSVSYLNNFNEAVHFMRLSQRNSNIQYRPYNINTSEMIVDRETLSKNIYNMIKDNDICNKYLGL